MLQHILRQEAYKQNNVKHDAMDSRACHITLRPEILYSKPKVFTPPISKQHILLNTTNMHPVKLQRNDSFLKGGLQTSCCHLRLFSVFQCCKITLFFVTMQTYYEKNLSVPGKVMLLSQIPCLRDYSILNLETANKTKAQPEG